MNAPARGARWLNATVLGVGLASLLSDVGHEMATAVMPGLLASLGASSAVLGLIEGLADGVSSFAKLASGTYSDHLRRRKPLAVVGYFLTAAGMASFAFATSAWHVLGGRVIGWFGRGARSPVRNVLLADATIEETYGRAFGLDRAMDSAGAVIGPALSLLLLPLVGRRDVFLLTLVPGVLSAFVIALFVRERPHVRPARVSLLAGFRKLPSPYRTFLLGVGLAGLGDFSNTLLILFATHAWTPRLGFVRAASLAMGFYVGYNVIYTISCYAAGALADRFPKQRVLAIGYAMAVIPAIALLAPGDSFLKFGIVFGFSGLYMGIWETVESSSAALYLPAAVRGTGFGVLATVNGIGDVASSAVVGALWVASPRIAMTCVILTSLLGSWVIASTRPRNAAADASEGG
jgi:MFS family permease